MLGAKAAREASAGPRVIHAVMRIVRAGIMSYPLIVPGVNMRQIRMTLLVHMYVVLGYSSVLVPSCRWLGPGRRCGSRTVSRNVSAANFRGMAAVWFAATPSLLRKSSHA